MIIALDARVLLRRHVGGAEQHARNVVAQWAIMPQQHEYLLLCEKTQQNNPAFDTSFVENLPPQFKLLFVRGLSLSLSWRMGGGRFLQFLARTLANYRPDIYHSFTPQLPRTRLWPLVQTVHDLAFELDADVRSRPESRELRRVARLGSHWAARIIAVSSQTRNDIMSIYHVPAERISVVHNGFNPAFGPKPNPALQSQLRRQYDLPRQYILAVGSDIPRRNYGRIFEAMEVVWQAEPGLCLVVAGRNDWRQTPLYARAQAAQRLGHMRFVDGPTDDELAQLYRDATMTCCGSSFEGFGLSVLESMACGTPVCCSDMRSLREVAEEAALYFPHDDALFMGQTLVSLLDDVEYRRQLKYRGLARAELFTWRKTAELILTLLEQQAATRS